MKRARELAAEARRLRAEGVDPIERRRERRGAERVEQAKSVTFKQCAESYVAAHEAEWRSGRHRQQWAATLAYLNPIIGALPVASIDTSLALGALEPIWTTKPETASRVRGRIESILDYAKARGYRAGENPARWRGHLDHLLAAKAKVAKIEHHAALPYDQIGDFMAALRVQTSTVARCLEFTILTAGRTGEVRGATWDEIDLQQKAWTVPAARMKAGKEHRVPLSARAVAILREQEARREGDYVFPGRNGAPLSNMTLWKMLRAIRPSVTTHGFRSSFSDWAHESTAHANHTIELSLAHSIGSKVEAAYRRGDLFEKRRRLMDDWARFCLSPPKAGAVVPLRSVR